MSIINLPKLLRPAQPIVGNTSTAAASAPLQLAAPKPMLALPRPGAVSLSNSSAAETSVVGAVALGNDQEDLIASLQAHAKNHDGETVDLQKPYGGSWDRSESVAKSWPNKDSQALAAWREPGMAKVFGYAVRENTSSAGDYLSRALSQNLDASYWYQLLNREGVIPKLSMEWRKALEAATLMLDIGDDGLGRTGYVYALGDANEFPGDLALKVAALIGGSGRGGLAAEKVISDGAYAQAEMVKWAQDAEEQREPSKATAAFRDLSFLKDPAEREQFASALLVTKLSDQSRGAAYSAVKDHGYSTKAALDALADIGLYKGSAQPGKMVGSFATAMQKTVNAENSIVGGECFRLTDSVE